MTARKCFTGKVSSGKVGDRAGRQLLDMLDGFEREHQARLGGGAAGRQAALDAVAAAGAEAARKHDLAARSAIAQANVLRAVKVYDDVVGNLAAEGKNPITLRGLRPQRLGGSGKSTLFAAVRSMLMRDPHEVASWGNVYMLARDIRGRAHERFAAAIEILRPKMLGFKSESVLELDVLRAVYGEANVDGAARTASEAWFRTEGPLADDFIDAGGALHKRDRYIPNPELEPAKIIGLGRERFATLLRDNVDRDRIIDFRTGLRMGDERFAQFVDEIYSAFEQSHRPGPPSAAIHGRPMLANRRELPRILEWKDAAAWMRAAEAIGTHQSVYGSMLAHISEMSSDIAQLRILGPNPNATRQFILDLFDREAARVSLTAPDGATPAEISRVQRENQKIAARVAADQHRFEASFAEMTGTNDIPVNIEMARVMSDARSLLVGAQMGSAMISSITDTATITMTARFNGLPAMNVLSRATSMMTEKGSEIFAAQTGLVADSIASAIGEVHRAMGETIRTGTAAKIGSGVVRASGLRRWSAVLRSAFGLEMMAHVARERGKVFAALDDDFREALGRYGIGVDDWELIRSTGAYEPRPNAVFIRPLDVAKSSRDASEKYARLINTEMDHAVIERDPVARSLMIGDTRPGTAQGEFWRAVGMYKGFPAAMITLHFARAFARGFDSKRLTHGGLTFIAMTMLGALAMQAKQINQGRDPYTLDPTDPNGIRAWGAAMLQGGGFGVFGDMLFQDKTRYGNSWAAIAAGPAFGAVESVVGDFLFKNIQLAARGEETHFLGDALYIAGRYAPGSSLWYTRLAFQRAILDQAALIVDDRARERFQRLEREARKNWGQEFWLPPGQVTPDRAPALFGGE